MICGRTRVNNMNYSNNSLKLSEFSLYKMAIAIVLIAAPFSIGLMALATGDVTIALLGAIGLAFSALMFMKPESTTVVVLFVLYGNLSVVAIRTYNVPDLIATSFFLLLGIPLLNYIIVGREKIVVNRQMFIMVIYFGIILISAAFSAQASNSMNRIRDFAIEGIFLYFLIINTIRTPSLVRWGVWAMIAAGMLMGGVSLYQEITGDYDNTFGGLAKVKESEVSTGEFDALGRKIKRRRLAGTIGSKNRYAQVMVALLPFAMMRIWAEKKWWLKLIAAAACVPIMSGALLTFSRGAGIAIILIILAMVMLKIIKVWHFLLISALGIAVVLAFVPDYVYRISTVLDIGAVFTGDVGAAGGSIKSRSNVNTATFNIFIDHPILGVGPGQTNLYTTEYGNEIGTYYRAITTTRRAHNMYLEELADTGFVGFSVFMSIVLYTIFQLWKQWIYWKRRQRMDIAYTAAGFFLGLLGFLATGLFLHLSYVRYYWFLLAFAGAFIYIYSEKVDKHTLRAIELAG